MFKIPFGHCLSSAKAAARTGIDITFGSPDLDAFQWNGQPINLDLLREMLNDYAYQNRHRSDVAAAYYERDVERRRKLFEEMRDNPGITE